MSKQKVSSLQFYFDMNQELTNSMDPIWRLTPLLMAIKMKSKSHNFLYACN